MNRILGKWDVARWLRLLAGTGFAVYGLYITDYYIVFLGILLLLMAVLNWSCCAAGGCSTYSGKKVLYKDYIKPYKVEKSNNV